MFLVLIKVIKNNSHKKVFEIVTKCSLPFDRIFMKSSNFSFVWLIIFTGGKSCISCIYFSYTHAITGLDV